VSGAGLVMTEIMADRIGVYCLALCLDECEAAMRQVVAFCGKYGGAKLSIKLAHAGCKEPVLPPWEARASVPISSSRWHAVEPSTISVPASQPSPRELSRTDIEALIDRFVAAVNRADRLGYGLVEWHGVHGYLIHQFLSPISNGGSLENQMRFPLELFWAMRQAWPWRKPMGTIISRVTGVKVVGP